MPETNIMQAELFNPTEGIRLFAVTIDGVDSAFIAWCIKRLMEAKLQAQVIAAYDRNTHVAYYFYRLID